MSILQSIEIWKAEGIQLNEGASLKDILLLEKEIDFELPQEFKVVYQSINGFKDWDWTPNMFSFFPLDRIKDEYYEQQNPKDFIPVFDFLINSHHLGYVKGQTGIFKDYDYTERICDNLYELPKLIHQDSVLVY